MDSKTQTHLHEMIRQDLSTSQRLFELLNNERQALQERHYNELVDIVAAKTEALDHLDQHEQERQALLATLSLEESEQQWSRIIESIDNPQLIDDWQALRESLTNCQRSNTINGRLIARGQQSLGRLLTILRGQVGTPELYNQDGIAGGHYDSNTVIKV